MFDITFTANRWQYQIVRENDVDIFIVNRYSLPGNGRFSYQLRMGVMIYICEWLNGEWVGV